MAALLDSETASIKFKAIKIMVIISRKFCFIIKKTIFLGITFMKDWDSSI